jgi:hypothetical protein
MAGTHRQINWTAVSFTPSGGSIVTMTNVQDVKIEPGVETIEGRGDANIGPTFRRAVKQNPSFTVSLQDASLLNSIVPGAVGAFTATHNDATNIAGGSGSGALTYTLSNAVVEDGHASGAHATLGTSSYKFSSFWTDGVTNPLAMVIA